MKKLVKTATIITLLLLAFSGCNSPYNGDENSAGDEAHEAAAAFKSVHVGILAKTPDTVVVIDEAAVDTALAAYNELSDPAKAPVAGEKTLLAELKSVIETLPLPGPVTIYMAGDSTMCDWTDAIGTRPIAERYGWGQFIQRYFDENVVTVRNFAHSGRSIKDFMDLENYSQIFDNIGPGDYLFVSFEHNDEKDSSLAADPQMSKDTEGTYKWYLYQKYIVPAREKGATPVLLSPVCRRVRNSGGKPPVNDGAGQDHGFFDDACRELATETGVASVTGSGLTVTAKGITKGSAVIGVQVTTVDGPCTVNVEVSVYEPAPVTCTLAVSNKNTSPAAPATENLLSWQGSPAWTGSNTITNMDASIGLSTDPLNMTVVYVPQPAEGVFTWKAKLKMSGAESQPQAKGLIFGALSTPQASLFKAVGIRYLANGSIRNVYHRESDCLLGTGTNIADNALDTEYIFEISRDGSGAYTGKVTDLEGNVKVSQWTLSASSLVPDLSSTVYPAFYLGGVSVTVSELSLEIELDE